MQRAELEGLLQAHGVPYHLWGTGESKTLDHLLAELNAGESKLAEKDGSLLRIERGVAINVYAEVKKQKLKLKEEKQVFSDGRPRSRQLSTSVGEKIILEETPFAAARRAMREELGLFGIAFSTFRVEHREPVTSKSFPGLSTQRELWIMDCELMAYQFDPNGYVEIQPDKTTYFRWVPLEG